MVTKTIPYVIKINAVSPLQWDAVISAAICISIAAPRRPRQRQYFHMSMLEGNKSGHEIEVNVPNGVDTA